MKLLVVFVLVFVTLCESNDFHCGYSTENMETLAYFCTNYKGSLPGNCSDTFLYENCRDNKSKVTHLKIGGCDCNKVIELLAEYENLQSLDISYSGIESFALFELKHENLVRVNVSHNRLTDIPLKFFLNLPKVNEVDFSYNQLTELIQLPEKMVRLDLCHNKISSLSKTYFANLHALEYLDMSYNSISQFDAQTIDVTTGLDNLKEFFLDGNELTSIDGITAERFPHLTKLSICKNQFPCKYLALFLQQIIEWPALDLIGNPFDQKHGENCVLERESLRIGTDIGTVIG